VVSGILAVAVSKAVKCETDKYENWAAILRHYSQTKGNNSDGYKLYRITIKEIDTFNVM
jgi:hypothetical protein